MREIVQRLKNHKTSIGRCGGRMGGRHAHLFVLATALMLLAGACSQGKKTPDVTSDVHVMRHSQKGPVQMTAFVDRTSAQVAEPITMSLTVKAPAGVTVQFPEVGESIGSFDVLKSNDTLDIPESAGRSWKRTYQLESLNSGTQEIPAISVSFTDHRQKKSVTDSLSSESMEIKIVSLLEGQADPMQFRDIKGLVEIPVATVQQTSWTSYGIVGGVLCLIASAALFCWYRLRKELTVRQWALKQLADLEGSGLLESGKTHEFYCKLTDIVRFYIERRFGYSAPKQTTTEFLLAMRTESLLQDAHRASLQEFLIFADMVKFACLDPSRGEAEQAIEKAREFVCTTSQEDTKSQSSTPEQVAA